MQSKYLMLCAALATCGQAQAQSIDFSGTRENVNPLSPPGSGRCSPPYFNTVEIAPGATSSTGDSNLGAFTSTQSHCIVTAPPTPVVDGIFTYNFAAGDSITGTYTGHVDATSTPGSFATVENLVVTGGTGRFVGASGTIDTAGSLAFANGSGVYGGNVNGTLAAAATTATGNYATAYGQATAAMGDYSSAFGSLAIANAERATAVGSVAQAFGIGSTAVGDETVASGLRSTALGALAQATGTAATALGHNTQATAVGATAVGVSAHATEFGTTAVGRLATAGFAGSTALGNGAATTAANQVALGGAGSSVRVGDIAASTAAQTGTVAVATVDGSGTVGRNTTLLPAVAALQAASASQAATLSGLGSDVNTLFDLREADRQDFKRGVAAAVAMGQAGFPSEPGKTSYVLNAATFRGEVAFGGSLMHRFDGETPFALGLGFSIGGKKNNAFRAGVAGEF